MTPIDPISDNLFAMILSANDAIKYPPDATILPHDTIIGFLFFYFCNH